MICGSIYNSGTPHLNVGLHLLWDAICIPPKNAWDRMTNVEDIDLEAVTGFYEPSTVSVDAEDVDLEAEARIHATSADSVSETTESPVEPPHSRLTEGRDSIDESGKMCVLTAYKLCTNGIERAWLIWLLMHMRLFWQVQAADQGASGSPTFLLRRRHG